MAFNAASTINSGRAEKECIMMKPFQILVTPGRTWDWPAGPRLGPHPDFIASSASECTGASVVHQKGTIISGLLSRNHYAGHHGKCRSTFEWSLESAP